MSETGPNADPAASLEKEADRLEHHLEELDEHIHDAQKAAAARREEATPDAAGDWEETRGAPGQGEDPEGAIGEHGAGEGATEADATEGEDADPPSAATGNGDPADAGGDRSDAVGSRMPGEASGGDD
jgi:hypothetical protein